MAQTASRRAAAEEVPLSTAVRRAERDVVERIRAYERPQAAAEVAPPQAAAEAAPPQAASEGALPQAAADVAQPQAAASKPSAGGAEDTPKVTALERASNPLAAAVQDRLAEVQAATAALDEGAQHLIADDVADFSKHLVAVLAEERKPARDRPDSLAAAMDSEPPEVTAAKSLGDDVLRAARPQPGSAAKTAKPTPREPTKPPPSDTSRAGSAFERLLHSSGANEDQLLEAAIAAYCHDDDESTSEVRQ